MNLVLNLTEQCNLRCSYCYYKEHPGHGSMPDEVLEQSISLAWHRVLELGHRQLNITFFGGEPLMRGDAIEQGMAIARRLQPKNCKLRFAINTNGTLLDEKSYRMLADNNFRIFLSVDGPAAIHDRQRLCADGSGSFAKLAPWLPRLAKLDTMVIRVVTHAHIAGLAESMAWIRAQGFKGMVTAVDFDGHWTGEQFDALADEYNALAEFWLHRKKIGDAFYLGTLQDKMRLHMEGSSYKEKTCHILEGAVAVSVRGDVFPCTRFVSPDSASRYCIGNVFQGIDEKRCTEIQDYLRADKPQCAGCSLRSRCMAHGCACVSYYTTGSLQEISPEVCTHERMLAEICDSTAQRFMGSAEKVRSQ